MCLVISISIVDCEATLSIGSCILDPFRSFLSLSTKQTLIYCQNWLRVAPIPINIRFFMDYIGNLPCKFKISYFILLFLYICLI
jgi:hypothetical protein